MIKYNTVFFDLDDTLIDTKKNSYLSLHEIFIDYKLQNYFESFDVFAEKYQDINNNLWYLYELGKIGKDELQAQRFYQTIKNVNRAFTQVEALQINKNFMNLVSEKTNLIEGAKEILDFLKQRAYRLNILSNGFKQVQSKKLLSAGLDFYFDHIILSDHIGKNKPHPDLFDHALGITETVREKAIMIGDNINTDILGAKNSNIDQIWFNPKKAVNSIDLCPTFEIDKLEKLREIL